MNGYTVYISCFLMGSSLWTSSNSNFLVSANGKASHFFNNVENWPDRSLSNLEIFGSAVAFDKNKNLLLLHRGHQEKNVESQQNSVSNRFIKEDTIFIVDQTRGKVSKSWGGNKFVKPHGIEVAHDGEIFVTDVALHQIFKFQWDQSTQLWKDEAILTLGEAFISGSDQGHFCGPADVSWVPGTGDFFVADGYCNSRVVKFDKNGRFLMEFGAGGSDNQFSLPLAFNVSHNIELGFPKNNGNDLAIKDGMAEPLLFVADRNNGRIQVFSSANGTFLYEIGYETFGTERAMILSLTFLQREQYEKVNDVQMDNNYFGVLYAVSGHLPIGTARIFELAVGHSNTKILSSFQVSSKASKATVMLNNSLETPHDIFISNDGKDIYLVEAFPHLILKKYSLMETDGLMNSGAQASFLELQFLCIMAFILL